MRRPGCSATRLLWVLVLVLLCPGTTISHVESEGAEEAAEEELGWGFGDVLKGFDTPSSAKSAARYTTFRNIWFHGQQFYAVVGVGAGNSSGNITQAPFLAGQPLVPLPIADTALAFANMLSIRFKGLTVALEHPYNAYPHDLTFWAEALVALTNTLADPHLRASTPSGSISKVLIPNLPRADVPPWALEMLKIAVAASDFPVEPGLQPDPSYPELLFLDDLDLVNMTYWVLMDELVTPVSRYSSKLSGIESRFSSPELAKRFRAVAYGQAQGAEEGEPGDAAQYFTLLTSLDEPQTVPANMADVMQALEAVAAEVQLNARHVEFSNHTDVSEIVRVMRGTKVLIGRTGSLLANAILLPPGSSLLELIPFNWAVKELDAVYRNMTAGTGDIGYSSWRAEDARFCAYRSKSDARFSSWGASDCTTLTCLEVHSRARVVVDIHAMRRMVVDLASV